MCCGPVFAFDAEVASIGFGAHWSWEEQGKNSPESRGFSVCVSNSVRVFTVADVSEGYSSHHFASLEIACLWVLHEPPFGLQMLYDFERFGHDAVCQLEVSWRFRSGSCN